MPITITYSVQSYSHMRLDTFLSSFDHPSARSMRCAAPAGSTPRSYSVVGEPTSEKTDRFVSDALLDGTADAAFRPRRESSP